ncbi:hypothetical protein CANCADRAFT_31617, partial [Tortispora caseinolytica NRRL Y-17796]
MLLSLFILLYASILHAIEIPSDLGFVPLSSHSLSPSMFQDRLLSRWFEFGGSTLIRADEYIRLTTNRPGQSGWIVSRVPIFSDAYIIDVEFSIFGDGILHGDGFAIWLTESPGSSGPVFGSSDNFNGLGIFIDTYKNNRPGVQFPLVMAMLGDGHTSYDNDHDGAANQLASCSVKGLISAREPSHARIVFVKDQFLSLDIKHYGSEGYFNCFTIPNVKLPP